MLLLKSIAPLLISIHGQNDTRALADVKNHIYLLDIYAKNAALTAEFCLMAAVLVPLKIMICLEIFSSEMVMLQEMLVTPANQKLGLRKVIG